MSSKSLNKVILIGNITRDPELRYTPQGNAVCTMGLATNRSWKTENGEIREEAEFHRLVAWNKLGELCSQLCSKGRKIYVEGRLQTRTFTGSDNAQHTITEIVIDDMILLDSKMNQGMGAPTGNFGGAPRPMQQNQPVSQPQASAPADDSASAPADDIKPAPKGKKKAAAVTEDEKSETVAEAPVEKAQEKPMKEDVNIDDIPF